MSIHRPAVSSHRSPWRLPALIPALLYAALSLGANPAAAQSLNPDQRAEVESLRSGDLRKLVVHAEPVPSSDIPFTDRAGGEHRFHDSDGAIRVVNFWATWCAPCREEYPALDALQKDLMGPDFQVMTIATGRNTPESIDRFDKEAGITELTSYLDPKSTLAREMNVPGLPVTLILNREGAEIARLLGGADWNGDSARAIIGYLTALPG